MLSLSNNPSVAGGNVFILGTTFENTADRLVAFGQSRGMRNFGVVYPAGLEGETARDAVATAVSGRGATLVASQPYNLSVEGIQAAAGPAAAALLGARRQRGDPDRRPDRRPRLHLRGAAQQRRLADAGAVHRHAALGRLGRGAGAAEPAGRGLRRPRPGLVAAFAGRYRTAYGEAPHELAGLAYDGIAAVGALIAEARARAAARSRPRG